MPDGILKFTKLNYVNTAIVIWFFTTLVLIGDLLLMNCCLVTASDSFCGKYANEFLIHYSVVANSKMAAISSIISIKKFNELALFEPRYSRLL